MKKITLTTTLLFIINIVFSQSTDWLTNLNDPTGMELVGNDLYICLYNDSKILKVDINNPINSQETVISNLDGPFDIVHYNNMLYISEPLSSRISKIDLSVQNPIREDLATGLFSARGLEVYNNSLFVSSNGIIYKIDISSNQPNVSEYITSINDPDGLAIINDTLYIADGASSGNGKIYKVDLTTVTPQPIELVSSGLTLSNLLYINGDYLYITQGSGSNKVSKIDISSNSPVLTDVVTNLNLPVSNFIHNGFLYTSEWGGGISRFELTTLSIEKQNIDNDEVAIYPNPINDFIRLKNVSNVEVFKIYDVNGKEILTGNINNLTIKNLNTLNKGLYILHIDDKIQAKFLKK